MVDSPSPQQQKTKRLILGQDPHVILALLANVISWLVHRFVPFLLPRLLPKIPQQQDEDNNHNDNDNNNVKNKNANTQCIVIGRPGGLEQLRIITLKPGLATCGYNLSDTQGKGPFTKSLDSSNSIPEDCVVVQIHAFSVNYADCCIRWGLYESANEFVGYPICPGFDISGVVEQVGGNVKDLKVGDAVYGCTLFGAYSTRVLVPALQLRKIPTSNNAPTTNSPLLLSMTQAAGIPAVALTSLYSLLLAGLYTPDATTGPNLFQNQSILIHSAAGGVGGMLVQMSRLLKCCSPIVGVVGHSSKVDAAKALGCDVVIDKSQYNTSEELWDAIRKANPTNNGYYKTVMDSSGVETLQQSYECLAPTGRVIVFGFHTNLPIGKDALSPMEWIKMGMKMARMPKFDPMDMVTANKAVLGFNLSFFANEREIVSKLFDQIQEWIETEQLSSLRVHEMPMEETSQAHDLIQSGKTVGKLVLTTPYCKKSEN